MQNSVCIELIHVWLLVSVWIEMNSCRVLCLVFIVIFNLVFSRLDITFCWCSSTSFPLSIKINSGSFDRVMATSSNLMLVHCTSSSLLDSSSSSTAVFLD